MGVDVIKPDKASFKLIEGGSWTFRSPRADALYRYWSSRCGTSLPSRADIEPADIKTLLPYILMVDIHRNPFRVYYRLVGTAVAHFCGLDFTGAYLDDLAFDICITKDLVNAYHVVCNARQPGVGMARAQINHQTVVDVEYVICPLIGADGEVKQCLALEDYIAKEGVDIGRLQLARQA